jgi:predicted nuclease with TOPRIM domain
MSETFEQSIVSHLEEHVELAISTVQKLRAEKLELEAEIARLNSDVLQRDTKIQELETHNSELEEELNLERLGTSQERSEIKERLEGLMNVLAASNETEAPDTGDDIAFTVQDDESDEASPSSVVGSGHSE